jgi:hypothetical protein
MSVDLSVPSWLHNHIREWAERLGIGEWHIGVQLALCVNDCPDTDGFTDQFPDLTSAHLTFAANIEDTDYWRVVVIHELLHVAHSRIDHLIESAVLPELPDAAHGLAQRAYHQQVEAYTHQMARALFAMVQKPQEMST